MPVVHERRYDNGSVVALWEITEKWETLFDIVTLDDSELNMFESFVRDQRKLEWLAVRALLQYIVGESVRIEYKPNGAPIVKGGGLNVSISHTTGYAAIAINPQSVVAIDVELVSERVLKVSDRFLSNNERSMIPKGEDVLYQTIVWSAKEALYKWWGQSDVIFKEHLLLSSFIVEEREFNIEAKVGKGNSYELVVLNCLVENNLVMVYKC